MIYHRYICCSRMFLGRKLCSLHNLRTVSWASVNLPPSRRSRHSFSWCQYLFSIHGCEVNISCVAFMHTCVYDQIWRRSDVNHPYSYIYRCPKAQSFLKKQNSLRTKYMFKIICIICLQGYKAIKLFQLYKSIFYQSCFS